jgi:carboxymethylenebutenolidase
MTTSSAVTLATDDGPMPAYQARPDGAATGGAAKGGAAKGGAAKGGVVVVQEAFGVNAHMEDVTRRFAAAGWDAVAPAFFHRQGSPVLDYDDLATVMPLLGQMTPAGLAMDLTAAIDHLAAAGHAAENVAVVGFCMGGTVTFYAATLRPLGAAVTFYGGGVGQGRFGLPSLVDLAPQLRTPWLGHFGDRDRGIPVAEVEALRAATGPLGVPSAIHRYADADHGFGCDARPAVFHPAAAGLAWERTLGWLDRHATAL